MAKFYAEFHGVILKYKKREQKDYGPEKLCLQALKLYSAQSFSGLRLRP